MERAEAAKSPGTRRRRRSTAERRYRTFLDRLRAFTVLDPACGSGNLKPLDTIECRDAILTSDDSDPDWPEADVVIGNPPFLGGKLLITRLGEEYVSRTFATYAGRVPAEADLVCYWFEKAGRHIASGKAKRAGLVATNSIRGGANRRALQAATEARRIFEAWSDEPWVIDGAAVRVSLVCFSRAGDESVAGAQLDGESVDEIYADLTARRGSVGEVVVVGRDPERLAAAERVLDKWAATAPESVTMSHREAAVEMDAIRTAIATGDVAALEAWDARNSAACHSDDAPKFRAINAIHHPAPPNGAAQCARVRAGERPTARLAFCGPGRVPPSPRCAGSLPWKASPSSGCTPHSRPGCSSSKRLSRIVDGTGCAKAHERWRRIRPGSFTPGDRSAALEVTACDS